MTENENSSYSFRTFLIMWALQLFSTFGSSLTTFAIIIWLTNDYSLMEQKKELAFALSAVSLANLLPNVFIAPFAGVFADRYDRKRTMIIMNFFSFCLSIILALLLLENTLHIWELLALQSAFSLANAFHNASFDASVVNLVKEKYLPRANGMLQTINSLSLIISPGLASIIIAIPSLARNRDLFGIIDKTLVFFHDGTPLVINRLSAIAEY